MRTIAEGYSFTEGPRWHEGRLYFSDFYTHRVLAVDGEGRVEVIATVPGQPSGLGWLPDGRMLVVSMLDRKLLRQEGDGRLVEHADLSKIATYHCNDMVVDTQGRAYVGNFGSDIESGNKLVKANLAFVDTDGSVSVAAEDLAFPNGAVITPDGKTLIIGESFGRCLTAFDIADDGDSQIAGFGLICILTSPMVFAWMPKARYGWQTPLIIVWFVLQRVVMCCKR